MIDLRLKRGGMFALRVHITRTVAGFLFKSSTNLDGGAVTVLRMADRISQSFAGGMPCPDGQEFPIPLAGITEFRCSEDKEVEALHLWIYTVSL